MHIINKVKSYNNIKKNRFYGKLSHSVHTNNVNITLQNIITNNY